MSMKFATNVPVEVALEYSTGKPVDGNFGPQVMYSLVGGEKMYVDAPVAAQITALGLAPREAFMICKSAKGPWKVARVGGGWGAADTPQKKVDPTASELYVTVALKLAVRAAFDAEAFAKEIGYAVQFSPADIRALGSTVLVGLQQQSQGAR